MLGRGVKRKRTCFEEDITVTTAGGDENDGTSDLPHLQQRQLVLRLCLDKLQSQQPGLNHGLHRSVLLVNTLRQIQEDMQRDGAGSPHPGTLLNTPDPSGAPSPGVGLPPGAFPLRDGGQEDMAPTCAGCAGADQLSASVSHPPSRLTSSETASRDDSSVHSGQGPSAPVHPVDPAHPLGYLADLAPDSVIFEDIDTSMYESSEFSSAWTVYPSWAVGVSSWGDEDLKTFPSCGSASTLPSYLTDINELDHIMEILVNS